MRKPCPCLRPVGDGLAESACPSHQNRCLAAQQPRVVAPVTQTRFCLTGQYRLCPYYPKHRAEGILPDIRPERSTRLAPVITVGWVAIVALALASLMPWARAESPTSSAASAPASTSLTFTATPAIAQTLRTAIQPETSSPIIRAVLAVATAVPLNLAQRPAGRPPDRIEIPSIGLDAPVVEVQPQVTQEEGRAITSWAVADGAVGYHRGTAYPGQVGNTVLSGHHNAKGQVFRHLIDVPIGAQIIVHVDQAIYPYVVSRKMILPEKLATPAQRQENARWIEPFPDERLTLVTCWPYDDNTHRLVVIAQPLVPPSHPAPSVAEQGQNSTPPIPE